MNRNSLYIYSVIMGLFGTMCCSTAHAQMLDLLSGAGVGGTMAARGAKDVAQGMNALRATQALQNLQMMVLQIKMDYPFGYQGLNGAQYTSQYRFAPARCDVVNEGDNRFSVTLSNVPQSMCTQLVAQVRDAVSVSINEQVAQSSLCSDNSKIKWIFE